MVNVFNQRRNTLIKTGQSFSHRCGKIAIHRMIIPVVDLFPAGDSNGHKADARFDESTSEQCLLSPSFAIASSRSWIFLRQIERRSGTITSNDFESLSIERVQGTHHPLVEVPAQTINLPQ